MKTITEIVGAVPVHELPKPKILIASYDAGFTNLQKVWAEIKKIKNHRRVGRMSKEVFSEKIGHLETQAKGISENLRALDKMIYYYVVDNRIKNKLA